MQKLKKSLENNIIKITLKESNNIFNVENPLGLSSSNKKRKYIQESKVLTTRFSKQIQFFDLLGILKLKYPLKLNTFNSIENFKAYLIEMEKTDTSSNIILIKNKNFIFKNRNYLLFKYNNSYQVINSLKSSSFFILKLANILKFQLNKDK